MICVFLEVITECEKESLSRRRSTEYWRRTGSDSVPGGWRAGSSPGVYYPHTPHPPPPPRLLSNLSSAHRSSSLSTVSSLDIGLFALKLAPTVWLLAKRTLAEVTQSENIWLLAKRPMQEKSLSRRIQWALIYAHMTLQSLLFRKNTFWFFTLLTLLESKHNLCT